MLVNIDMKGSVSGCDVANAVVISCECMLLIVR